MQDDRKHRHLNSVVGKAKVHQRPDRCPLQHLDVIDLVVAEIQFSQGRGQVLHSSDPVVT